MTQRAALLTRRQKLAPWGWLVAELTRQKDRGAASPVDRPVPASLTLTAKKLRA